MNLDKIKQLGFEINRETISFIYNSFGISGHDEVESIEFKKWSIAKTKLIYSDLITIDKRCSGTGDDAENQLLAVYSNNKIYIISPKNMYLCRDTSGFNRMQVRSIDFTNLDISNTQNMNFLFTENKILETVNFGESKPPKIFGIVSMFSNCQSIKSIDLSKIDLSQCYTISQAFYNCINLEYLNLGNLQIEANTHTTNYNTFKGCKKLRYENIKTLEPPIFTEMLFLNKKKAVKHGI